MCWTGKTTFLTLTLQMAEMWLASTVMLLQSYPPGPSVSSERMILEWERREVLLLLRWGRMMRRDWCGCWSGVVLVLSLSLCPDWASSTQTDLYRAHCPNTTQSVKHIRADWLTSQHHEIQVGSSRLDKFLVRGFLYFSYISQVCSESVKVVL